MPDTFVIAIDANAAALAERSRRAAAKPARGGLSNILFVRGSVEALPEELTGLASKLTVLFPWGSLLRTVLDPTPAFRQLCRDSAAIEIALGLSVEREKQAIGDINEELLHQLVARYTKCGFALRVEEIDPSRYETTWSKKLAQDRARRFFCLRGRAILLE